MTYFKIIQEDKVTSVGTVFLKWNVSKHKFYLCDVDKGQCVQTYDEKYIYNDTWMKPVPEEATGYFPANVVIISAEEYEELLELLQDNEEILIKQEEPVIETHLEPETTQEERPMTISEMRALILKQQEQIDSLIEKIT